MESIVFNYYAWDYDEAKAVQKAAEAIAQDIEKFLEERQMHKIDIISMSTSMDITRDPDEKAPYYNCNMYCVLFY